tara:strand:- start:215 stop:511 length:297 start_codon:yes stop_codon:yes gene_type:complete
MTSTEVADLSNKITLENLEQLIWIFRDRISIFVGTVPIKDGRGLCISGELDEETPVCLNGATIQINMERSFSDDNDNYLCELLKGADLKQLIKESEVE